MDAALWGEREAVEEDWRQSLPLNGPVATGPYQGHCWASRPPPNAVLWPWRPYQVNIREEDSFTSIYKPVGSPRPSTSESPNHPVAGRQWPTKVEPS